MMWTTRPAEGTLGLNYTVLLNLRREWVRMQPPNTERARHTNTSCLATWLGEDAVLQDLVVLWAHMAKQCKKAVVVVLPVMQTRLFGNDGDRVNLTLGFW